MSYTWMISVLIIMSISPSINGSYQYVGCYTQVFYDSFFTSGLMEPTLCFRLCNTQIIYLQKSVCRCSGAGLMDYNRKSDSNCWIPCMKEMNRQVNTSNTCGGERTYSVYAEEGFFTRHGHLVNYQIQFRSCELWSKYVIYNTLTAGLDGSVMHSSLNKLEQCAAACLDLDLTTKSIAFKDDSNECLCILSWPSNPGQILPNTSCNRYCNNTSNISKVENAFQCGSLRDPLIQAIYDLNSTCLPEFTYINELKKCLYYQRLFSSSCPSPSKTYIFDGNITWSIFLKIIEKLKLNDSSVTIDFDADITVDPSLKCPKQTTLKSTYPYVPHSYAYNNIWSLKSRYTLLNGCLRDSLSAPFAYRFSYSLCVTDPVDKYSSTSSSDGGDSSNEMYIMSLVKSCPPNWFDLNGRCYRMSNERKTIQDARSSCINISKSESNRKDQSDLWLNDIDEDDDDDTTDDQLNNAPKGDIVQYTSQWQARFGFYLLDDAVPVDETTNTESSTQPISLYYEDLSPVIAFHNTFSTHGNEFQMIKLIENDNVNITDDSCIVSTRTVIEAEQRPMLENIPMKNCSKARHVLCETKTLIAQGLQRGCFRKPMTLDLPALISNHLTYELCLSVCKQLQTKITIIHFDKCYCLHSHTSIEIDFTTDLAKYKRTNCGKPCSGNQHEQCGDEDTVVAFTLHNPRLTVDDVHPPAQPFPEFAYDSCIQINSWNSTALYKFKLTNIDNNHPRHCLQLCLKYQQKYTLINSDNCLCTNIPIEYGVIDSTILTNQLCSRQCSANYFYTCGSRDSPATYSMYTMLPKCRHGFEVAENNQQCVYSHLSVTKKSFAVAQFYCNALDGVIARINDVLEIQDILSESILNSRFLPLYRLQARNDIRYFWIDRTSDQPDNSSVSERSLGRCSQTSDTIDRNCIAIGYEMKSYRNITIYIRCITESDRCSSISAMPVCVNPYLDLNSTVIPSTMAESDSPIISANISSDYSCGNNSDYHFVDDYCYKISFHEDSWNKAKAACEADDAMLFVPEKVSTLQIIKFLSFRRNTYTSSGFAHVGVIYDDENRTVIAYNNTKDGTLRTVPDSNAVYDECEKTFHERYRKLMSSTHLTTRERNQLKEQQSGCAYIDLASSTVPIIRCDEIPCARTAIIICQKLPIVKTVMITVEREKMEATVDDDTNSTSTDDQSPMASSDPNSPDNTRSIGRDYAPFFFVLAMLFALILLGSLHTLHHHGFFSKNYNIRKPYISSVYSPVTTTTEEFDLN